nr:hypothetical protein Iba_chr04aCG6860 [Ipomoea batatas]GMC83989.1 hypothetical protein Iba_chr04cCG7320 [Ipomoea batatas]GMC88317.1 hypothetical protein Iba_chr04eCG8960 [Ipomoea batatas]
MLEALPAVTVPPVSLKLGRSFLNFEASNFPKPSSLSTIVDGFPLPPDTSTCTISHEKAPAF